MEEPYSHDCHLCSEELVDLTWGSREGSCEGFSGPDGRDRTKCTESDVALPMVRISQRR